MAPQTDSLLLLLLCLAGTSASEREQNSKPNGPAYVAISGVDVVTVGVPYGFTCTAECTPACVYTWTRDGHVTHGRELDILLKTRGQPVVLTCEARNPVTGRTSTNSKTLHVTVGPWNVQITGPSMMSPRVNSTFVCSADCYPSCNYNWFVNSIKQKNVNRELHLIPYTGSLHNTLTCEAQNSVSHLFAAATIIIWVTRGPWEMAITGPSSVTVGTSYRFLCVAYCTPSCNFMWTFRGKNFRGDLVKVPILSQDGKPMQGDKLVITVDLFKSTEELECKATNSISGDSATINKTLILTDPIAVRPLCCASAVSCVLCAAKTPAIADRPFYLQCAGAEGQASIQWSRNGKLISTSDRVRLSVRNSTLTFDPLLQSDGGLYQCIVSEGGGVIPGISYQMDVNYGPVQAVITQSGKGRVGKEVLLLPGSRTTFVCSADCYPACSYTWILNGRIAVINASLSVRPVTLADGGALTCVAYNSVTRMHSADETTLEIVDPIAVRPLCCASAVSCVLCAAKTPAIADRPFYLQCAGAEGQASIQWSRNGKLISTSDRVRLSVRNSTLTFDPLLQSDGGLYQCIVSEGGGVIPGISYQMDVNYGPVQAVITQSGKGRVGKEVLLLPGSRTTFVCSADCYPACSYTWILNGRIAVINASLSVGPVTLADGGALTCVAYNSVTRMHSADETTLEIVGGPSDVTISGPSSLEVGVKASFVCSARCSPPCDYTWTIYGKTVHGSNVDIIVNRYVATESVSCVAQNTITGRTAAINETLNVTDPDWCGC